ncbi:hypothetical protein CTheo_959 [Ceratobasidium theobromae]|uniref:RlpA-like protein double-psi beta-barrel domain-containing protein n=1 Tax=Ceratobasidium theobromae TaxID=1582974 RepID=A0A5N5QV01_9AGAM|nr:hypothetical protein CTheo_959 [Ceratobasidium theobromae]
MRYFAEVALFAVSALVAVNAAPVASTFASVSSFRSTVTSSSTPSTTTPTYTLESAPIELVGRGTTAKSVDQTQHRGWATNYNTQTGRGACGWNNKNSEHVVAIGKPLWESTQDGNGTSSKCGKTATVRYKGKSVQVRVVDECPVCGYNDIDLSISAFTQLADKNDGKIEGITWSFD